MMKKILLICLVCLFFINLISAAADTNVIDDVFKLHQVIDYKKACFNNGTYCSANAVCNYTIFNPDGSVLIKNNQSTNQGSFHNLTFTVPNIGIYQVDMVCIDGTAKGSETLYFKVTGDGFNDTGWFYLLILVLSIGIMIIGFHLEDAPIVILGSFGLYFLGLYILFYGLVGIKDPIYTWSSGLIVLAVAFYISAKSSYELIVS